MLDCSIMSLYHVTKSTGATFFVIQEYLVRSCWRRRCIKECATAVAQVTGALLNATRLWSINVVSNKQINTPHRTQYLAVGDERIGRYISTK